ncbi:acetyl-CoA synthetase-like protein [Auricularia subglabra TFB-10046 SS5]|nr:acetyl-CoA synthetase-like protein [Auricularia subglabra TFB-10046 SS5]
MPFVAPAAVTPQATQCPLFTPPPIDGSCTLVEAYDWHLEHSPDHVYYKYEHIDGSIRTVTWREEVQAVYRAARIAVEHAPQKPCFAVLAVTDSISYITFVVGLMRAGFVPFLPSPRVSPEVLAQLLDKAGVTHIYLSADAATTKLATAGTAHRDVTLLQLPPFEVLFNNSVIAPAPPPVKPYIYDTAAIIHSSGSTSIPKLLPLTFSTFALLGISSWNHEIDVGSWTINYAAAPMFHLFGLSHLGLATYSGSTIAVFPPVSRPIVPRVETFLHSVVTNNCQLAMALPSLLETISLHPDEMEKLARCELVLFAGAALKAPAGDRLADAGVKLIGGYGMSECGLTTALFTRSLRKDWQWYRMGNFIKPVYRDLEDGTYELILLSHDLHHIDSPNCEIDGHKAITTKDVVVRHPTDPTLFKVVGRLDDQIVLSTGEKTNALPLEGILCSNPHISHAVIFGRGRPHNGVIVLPKPQFAFDPSDHKLLQEFRDTLWPTVVKMNEFAPSHSRLVKEMILVASPSKPFMINATKNTAVRSAVVSEYEREIEAAYEEFERASEPAFPPPESWQLHHTLPFVRELARGSLPDVTGDDDDFFNFGCDSLKAARIQNNIVSSLRATGAAADRLPTDIVYKFPTISTLATFVSATGLSIDAAFDATAVKAKEIEDMLAKYTQSFPAHTPSTQGPEGLAVLVTGTTGGLGTNLLAQLLVSPDVRRVYALNRPGPAGSSLLNRHTAAFLDRGVDPALLDLDRFILLEGDTTREDLGIPASVYDELRQNVTHIIHNAWPVNFNYAVQTFEPAVRGARNLVDLALKSTLSSPPRYMFTSSVSVSRFASPSPGVPAREEHVQDVKRVVGFGYPESKWIVEQMLHIASETTPLRTVSVRVGQLAGGSSGCWNVSDWVPVIVRSAAKLGCLPDATGNISWLRLDEAAAALIEMRDASGILHLVHPRPIPWSTVLATFSKDTGAPLMPWSEWIARLAAYGAKGADAARDVPALRLLEFWRSFGEGGLSGMSSMELIATDQAEGVSPTLKDMAPLSAADAGKWLAYWKRAGVLL